MRAPRHTVEVEFDTGVRDVEVTAWICGRDDIFGAVILDQVERMTPDWDTILPGYEVRELVGGRWSAGAGGLTGRESDG